MTVEFLALVGYILLLVNIISLLLLMVHHNKTIKRLNGDVAYYRQKAIELNNSKLRANIT